MDSRERDERAKKGRSERGEKLHDDELKHRDENNEENKKSVDTDYMSLAGKYDPSDDSEFDSEPDDVNDEIWDPEEDEDEDDDEDYEDDEDE